MKTQSLSILKIGAASEMKTLLFFLTIFLSSSSFAQVTCNASGTWSGTASWVPASPNPGDDIIVAAGCTLYVDVTTILINDLTINGVVIINNTGGSVLSMDGALVVNSGASLINNGRLDFQTLTKNFNLNGTGTYVHNPINNLIVDENIFSNSSEVFSTTSNLIIQKWYDGNVPLAGPTRIQSSIMGNVTLSANVPGGTWDQDGFFSIPSLNRIRGSLTVTQSTVVMDDGTGSTTSLILQDVTVSGTGNIIFQRGYNRNYSLQVNNFTVNSSSPALPTVVMDTSFGILNMTVNGSMNIGYDFNAVFGDSFLPGANIRITVNGNLNITGGQVVFNNNANAPLLLNVNGTTTLDNNTPGGLVCFVEGGSGTLTLNTQDLIISGGQFNYFHGRPGILPAVIGALNLTVSNDFFVNGNSKTFIAYSDTCFSKIRISVGRDFALNGLNAVLTGAYTNGAFTFKAFRNFTQTNGSFTGQAFKQNVSIDSIITGGNFTFNTGSSSAYFIGNKSSGNTFMVTSGNFNVLSSGMNYGEGVIVVDSSSANLTFSVAQNFIQNGGSFSGILSGSGTATFTTTGIFDLNGGVCKIHNNSIYSNSGNINFTVGSVDYNGGVFYGFYSCNNNGLVGNFMISGACRINFNNSGDIFSFIGLSVVGSDVNNLQLFLSVPNGIEIDGANGTFFSSEALGSEFINIGSLTISNGINSFNGQPGSSLSTGHFVSLTVNGNINITGGNTYLSAMTQTILATINGDINLSGGSLSIKGSGTTNSTLNVLGAYNHTAGNFYMHNHPTDKMPEGSAITMTVNSNEDNVGNYTHTGGVFAFDNCATTPASMNLTLFIKSPNYTLGGNGQMTMSSPGTGSVYGILSFARIGTINFNRSGTHNIQQVRQNILGACTLDVVSGDMQLQTHNSATIPPDALWVFSGATLDLRTNKILNNTIRPYGGISVFGRVRTQNVNGLYDGSTNASFSTTLTDNFDFYIASSSTIEYYGVDNQKITGLGVGKALLPQHKYGNLEINFTGTPDVEFVFPTNIPNDSAVMVRAGLFLRNGELNLDDDHDPTNFGGRWIVLENPAVTSLTRTNGYVRSEAENGNGLVKWILNNINGIRTVPFGYNSGSLIPFVFNNSSSSSAILYAATYHTDLSNLVYPPTVTHVRNNSGLDNSANTVDRFWYINTSGNISSADITFNCTPLETGTITNLVAQKWDAATLGWAIPQGIQISMANGVQANPISLFNNWWTLSGNSVLLPIELLSFKGTCQDDDLKLQWETATEINNAFFTIEKSTDAIEWESKANLTGAGNSSQINSYAYFDNDFKSSAYFRLRQTDFDGKSTLSPIIYTQGCISDNTFSVSLANSFDRNPKLLVNSNSDTFMNLSVYNLDGTLLKTNSVYIQKGENIFSVNYEHWVSGLYIIRLSGANENYSFKYVSMQ